MRIRSRLAHLKRPDHVRLLIQVFASLVWIRTLVRRYKITRILEILDPGQPRRHAPRPGELALTLKFADFCIREIFRSPNPCLLRSLYLFRRIRSAGIDVRIAFGVGDLDTDFKGHAWLTIDGTHVMEREDPSERYEAVFVYP